MDRNAQLDSIMASLIPADPRTIEERLKQADTLFQQLEKQKKSLLEQAEELRKEHVDKLEKVIDPLKKDASVKDIDTATKAIKTGHREIKIALKKRFKKLEEETHNYVEKCDTLQHTYYMLEVDPPRRKQYVSPEDLKLIKDRQKLLKTNRDLMIDNRDDTTGGVRERTVHQLQMRKSLKNLDLEMQLTVENSIFSHFLNEERTQKPQVEIAPKTDITSNKAIPPEIMSMVYGYSSLESAVALRQVSSCWYSAFSQNEHILERKLLLRSPWFKPEGDLSSWALCVLVFVSRLANEKWSSHKNMSRLTGGTRPQFQISMLAYELGPDEKLSKTFKSFETHKFPCFSKWCDKVHFGNIAFNPKNHEYETQTKGEYGAELVVNDGTQTVFLFEGYELILPFGLGFPMAPRQRTFESTSSYIVVRTSGKTFVLPKSNPNYKQGFSYSHDYGSFEIGGVYIRHTAPYDPKKKNTFEFYNKHTRQFIPYDGPAGAIPVSHYNGIVWWWAKDCKLIPIFVDQSEPDTLYNNSYKGIILGDLGDKPEPICGGHYLARVSEGGMLLIDMVNCIISDVLFPKGQGKMLVGRDNGMFVSRYVSQETINKWFEKGKKVVENKS